MIPDSANFLKNKSFVVVMKIDDWALYEIDGDNKKNTRMSNIL